MEFYLNIIILIVFIFVFVIILYIKKFYFGKTEKVIQIGNGQYIGRSDNQSDYFFSQINKDNSVFLGVASGIADKKSSKYASVITIEFFKNSFKNREYRGNVFKFFDENYCRINKYLSDNSFGNATKTTFLGVLIKNNTAFWSSVGSCKLLLYRNGEMIDLNDIYSATKNYGKVNFEVNDSFILCTEGVFDILSEMEIINEVKQKKHPYYKAQKLIKKIKDKKLIYQKNATILIIEKNLFLS